MPRTNKHPSLGGPALVRLLTRLIDTPPTGAAAATPRAPLSDRLSQWLGWSDAITLSSILNDAPTVTPAMTPADKAAGEDDGQRECDRLRARLLAAINSEGQRSNGREPDRRLRAQPAEQAVAVDYAAYRDRYVALQQIMESDIERLRPRLRSLLAARSAAMTRLAMVDALMERTLAARERGLLAAIPGLLEKHFNALKQASENEANENEINAAPKLRWLSTFRQDMRGVLRAELEVRMLPVEGLLAALTQPQTLEPDLKTQ